MLKIKRKKVEVNRKGMHFTHDNGGRPFAIKLIGNQVHVFEFDRDNDKEELYIIGKVPIKNKSDLMIGIDNEYKFNGNSVLIRLKQNKYLFIGSNIYELTTNDKILKYFSPVGNSDVPYPYAVGENYTYLLIEGNCIDNRYLKSFAPKDKNFVPYTYYYGWDGAGIRTDGIKPFKHKVIVPRRWNLPDFI